ncbi:SOS response-associated peptidase [Pseudoclavibacter sp. CFCC 13611]|uniref:SOS response-associated peptidase n=1 Tax=Pseudoclavibacter sp. CFCC 13611 TaxID=2615178 RepID=UPI001300E237|nr:SOS response-associated peptidase [Pseudoclavibacter sp. CFCC 13611]KAB1664197.1 SOS response-associated peptidase [Pseudoclavibacter sp. CFCC 13611]
MCGRIVQTKTSDYVALFDVDQDDTANFTPTWNLKPTQSALVVADGDKDGIRRLTPARWSLVPTWSTELRLTFPTFNARIETAGQKPTFRASMKRRRCVFPIDGYYEWQTVGKTKTPYFVHAGSETTPLALAGLYSWWRDPSAHASHDAPTTGGRGGSAASAAPDSAADASREPGAHGDGWVLTATVLTQPAAPELDWLHDRMPVVLDPHVSGRGLLDAWLDPNVDGSDLAHDVEAASAAAAESIVWHQVSPLRGDGPELIAPI